MGEQESIGSEPAGSISHLLTYLGELIADSVGPGLQPIDWPAPEQGGILSSLAESIGCDEVDVALLVCAAAPSLDPRFGELYAALDGRLHRGSVRVDIALRLAGGSLLSSVDRDRFGSRGALVRAGFIDVMDPELPLPDRTLSVPERVVSHLVTTDFDAEGVLQVDPQVASLLIPTASIDTEETLQVIRSLTAGLASVWIRDRAGGGASVAASALRRLGVMSLVLDLGHLPSGQGLIDVVVPATREACLWGAGLVISGVDPRRDLAALRAMSHSPRPTIYVSRMAWDPAISSTTPVLLEAPRFEATARQAIWHEALGAMGFSEPGEVGDVVEDLATLQLSPEQILQVAQSAVAQATATGGPVSAAVLRTVAFSQSSAKLDALTTHVSPRVTFDDIVLPPDVYAELRQLPDRYRLRHIVRDEWGMDRSAGRGRGISCLFAGPSGTGKTLAAEVVANSLGVELFIINLSQVVDKYVGETEKTLERVFAEAEGLNAVLLFDEADALFGKRSEVKGAHDRYANVEVAYLLQRIERFEGIAVLTTNLRGNVDEAFTRRLDLVCSFPEPSAPERLRIWANHLPPAVPLAGDVDLPLLAETLAIAGGTIRSITLTAAYAAAIEQGPVTMMGLVAAAEREYRKMGRLFNFESLKRWMAPPTS